MYKNKIFLGQEYLSETFCKPPTAWKGKLPYLRNKAM